MYESLEKTTYGGRLTEAGILGPAFILPFKCILSGPSGCGKSTLLYNILSNQTHFFSDTFIKVFYHYSENQPMFDHLRKNVKNIRFIKGLPKIPSTNNPKKSILLIYDDLMDEAVNSKETLNLFTKGSHHQNISVLFISQNIFFQGRYSRTISLNTDYIILFKSPRDSQQVSYLSKQMFPDQPYFLKHIFISITYNKPYSHIFIDLKQTTKDNLRFWSDAFTSHPKALLKI
jgi:hypothetical protein